MKIGIIADTHDNIPAIKKAVRFFNTQDLEYIIHAGDYVAPFSLKELMHVKARFIGVFGNNDGEQKGLLGVCKDIHTSPYTITIDGKTILVSHMPEISTGKPLCINPGECCGWVSGKSTVALLNLKTFHAEIVDLLSVS